MAKKKKKKSGHLLLLVIVILCCQYVAAHMSGWLIEAGEWNLMRIGELFDYFSAHPLDLLSFHPAVYGMVYLAGFGIYFHLILKTDPPRAEMKGKEHGSNDFMSYQELAEYRQDRITPDFPYSMDCRVPAEYPKKGKKK